jgi:hypothetical protein
LKSSTAATAEAAISRFRCCKWAICRSMPLMRYVHGSSRARFSPDRASVTPARKLLGLPSWRRTGSVVLVSALRQAVRRSGQNYRNQDTASQANIDTDASWFVDGALDAFCRGTLGRPRTPRRTGTGSRGPRCPSCKTPLASPAPDSTLSLRSTQS